MTDTEREGYRGRWCGRAVWKEIETKGERETGRHIEMEGGEDFYREVDRIAWSMEKTAERERKREGFIGVMV